MFLLKMMLHSILRNKRQSVLIGVTTVVGITLSVAMLSTMLGIQEKVNLELKSYGANIEVTPKSTEIISDLYGTTKKISQKNSLLNEADLVKIKAMFWGFNILDINPYVTQSVTLEQENTSIELVGSWFHKTLELANNETMTTGLPNIKKWWKIEGDWLTDQKNDDILVGQRIAQKYDLNVGETIKLVVNQKENSFIIKGIFQSGDEDENKLFTQLSTVQRLSNAEGKVASFDVSALTTPDNDLARRAAINPNSLTVKEKETWYCTAYASSISYQIQEVLPDVVAKPVRKIAESEGKILEKNKLLLILVAILSVIGAAVGAANLISATLMERNVEVGLKEALGITTSKLLVELLSGIFVINCIAGVVGFILGQGVAQIIGYIVFGSSVPFSFSSVFLTVALVLFISSVGSIPTIHYLITFKPADVLHGRT